MAHTQSFIEECKELLLKEKTRLEEQLGRFAKKTKAEGEFETQMSDIGTDETENAIEVTEYVDNRALEETLEHELQEVLAALKRIEDGTYGADEQTGEDIPEQRLRAYPAARVSVK
jgi:RNA polymerase-binding transcription factor DksA